MYTLEMYMSDAHDEELGRRIFELQKEKVVEGTVEKIRHAMRSDRIQFSASEWELLHYLLGEAWIAMDREKWERCAFSRLTRQDLMRMVVLGSALQSGEIDDDDALAELQLMFQKTFE
jgi:hypothetical protein